MFNYCNYINLSFISCFSKNSPFQIVRLDPGVQLLKRKTELITWLKYSISNPYFFAAGSCILFVFNILSLM